MEPVVTTPRPNGIRLTEMERCLWLALTVGVLLAGCSDAPADAPPQAEEDLFFATKPEPDEDFMQALYRGPLVVRDGCVLIGSPGEYTVPIWPKDFTAERNGSDRVIVRDADGSIVATEGQAFEMGGGFVAEFRPQDKVEPRQDQLRRVEASLGYSIPERCVAPDVYGVWSVGETQAPS